MEIHGALGNGKRMVVTSYEKTRAIKGTFTALYQTTL